jgi:hypothetical protein
MKWEKDAEYVDRKNNNGNRGSGGGGAKNNFICAQILENSGHWKRITL